MGTLTIQRRRALRGCVRSYAVVVDGRERGSIRVGRTWSCALDPGEYEVWVRCVNRRPWNQSRIVEAHMSSGEDEEIVLVCGPTRLPSLLRGDFWREVELLPTLKNSVKNRPRT